MRSSARQTLRITECVLKALQEEEEMSERTGVDETSVSSADPAHLEPQKVEGPQQNQDKNYRDSIVHAFVGLHFLVWLRIVLRNQDYHQSDTNSVWLYWVLAGSIAITIGLSRLAPIVATRGERLMLSLLCGNVWILATIAMLLIASPCVNCAHFFTNIEGAAAAASPASASSELFTAEYHTGWRFWHLILQEEDDSDVNSFGKGDFATMTCRRCISDAASLLTGEGWHRAFAHWGWSDDDTTNVKSAARDWSAIKELPVEDQPIHQDAGDLAAWYMDYANQTRTRDLRLFNDIVAEALVLKGHLSGEALAEALEEFFCSPASRVDQPDPTKFLADIQKARFTGEDANGVKSNLTSSKLQKIMRGDYLRELGVRYVTIVQTIFMAMNL